MKLKVVLAVLIGILVLACSTAALAPVVPTASTDATIVVEPTPNIDATVEARLAHERAVDATVEARLKEKELLSQLRPLHPSFQYSGLQIRPNPHPPTLLH